MKKYDGYTTNKATLPSEDTNNVNGKAHRKENAFYMQYTVVNPTTRKEIVELRLYATNAMHTACLWTYGPRYCSGSGKAGGYGYHRASSAAAGAIAQAGIKLAVPHFGGMGDSAIETALLAIGRAYGCRNPWIIKAHA